MRRESSEVFWGNDVVLNVFLALESTMFKQGDLDGSFIREMFGGIDNSGLVRKVESGPVYVPHEPRTSAKSFRPSRTEQISCLSNAQSTATRQGADLGTEQAHIQTTVGLISAGHSLNLSQFLFATESPPLIMIP